MLLECHKIDEVVVVQRVRLAEVPARVELVVPDLLCGGSLLEEQDDGLHASAEKRTTWAVEYGMEVAALEEQLPEADRGVIGVGEERILDDDARTASGSQHLDEVLEEQECRLARPDRGVLLDLLAFLSAEGWVREDDIDPVLLL